MRTFIITDTHFNHDRIVTHCKRPDDYSELLIERWQQRVVDNDRVIHCGDVFIHKAEGWDKIWPLLPGHKILIRGNHDWKRSCSWWMDHGFEFACDAMVFRGAYLTHVPAKFLPEGCNINIHGHLHNIWHGFHTERTRNPYKLNHEWQRLLACEYTDYYPIEFEHFVSHPKKFHATGLGD